MEFSDSDAKRLLRIIDERVEARLKQQAQYHWGTVASVDTSTRTCTVYLFGETVTASEGFRFYDPLLPSTGQIVRVVINGDERWIDVVSAGATASVITADQLTVRYGGNVYFPDQSPGNDPSSIGMFNEDASTRVMRIRAGDDAGDAVDVGYYYFLDGTWHSGVRMNVNGHLVTAGPINSEDSAWAAPTLTNSWANYGGVFNTTAYRLDSNGYVHLKGLIRNGTVGSAAFTLPTGYRPAAAELRCVISNGAIGRVDIDSSGVVTPSSPASAVWVSLDGIIFKAA